MATIRLRSREVKTRDLPFVCMKCGRPAAVWKSKVFDWESGTRASLRLLGPVPVGPNTLRVELPLCRAHRYHWLGRSLFGWGVGGLLLAGFGVLIYLAEGGARGGGNKTLGIIAGISCVGLPIWVLVMIALILTAIRPAEISDDGITLKGVSWKFADSLEKHRRTRAEERRQGREPGKGGEELAGSRPGPRKRCAACRGMNPMQVAKCNHCGGAAFSDSVEPEVVPEGRRGCAACGGLSPQTARACYHCGAAFT